LRYTVKRLLEIRGYSVLIAANGVEALECFRAHPQEIDLVISDLVMPRMSGAELFETLQTDGHSVRFLLTSGYTDREVRERIDVEHGLPFVRKPWSLKGLLAQVRELLDRPAPAPVCDTESIV
jgi:CheY-like chemotaxis protein